MKSISRFATAFMCSIAVLSSSALAIGVQSNAVTIVHGTLTAANGTMIMVKLDQGGTQTYQLPANAPDLQFYVGNPITFTVTTTPGGVAVVHLAPPRATVAGVRGTVVALRFPDGTTQTFNAAPGQIGVFHAYIGRTVPVAYTTKTLRLASDQTLPLTSGRLLSVRGTTAKIRLANGTTTNVRLNTLQAARLRAHIGQRIAFRLDTSDRLVSTSSLAVY